MYILGTESLITEIIVLLALFTLYNLYIIHKRKKLPILISIDGNIGVGKSTFTDLLKQYLDNADFL